MDQREVKVVEGALRAFARFGVRRSTMSDIASEVGVARQTLYSIFPTKDDILRATILYASETAIAAIRVEWQDAKRLHDRLDIFFKHHSVRPFEQIQAAPDPADSIAGFNEVGRKEIADSNAAYRQVLEEIFEPYKQTIAQSDMTVRELADLVQMSASGFKQMSGTKKQLLKLLNSLKHTVLSVTGEA